MRKWLSDLGDHADLLLLAAAIVLGLLLGTVLIAALGHGAPCQREAGGTVCF